MRTLNLWPREFSPAARRLIVARSGGVCEGCGVAPASQIHHRLFKSRLGFGNPANGLHVCVGAVGGNIDGCHGTAHAGYIGESLGWSIRSGFDPLLVPTFRRVDATWWRFDDAGDKEQINPLTAIEYLVLIGAIREGVMR